MAISIDIHHPTETDFSSTYGSDICKDYVCVKFESGEARVNIFFTNLEEFGDFRDKVNEAFDYGSSFLPEK